MLIKTEGKEYFLCYMKSHEAWGKVGKDFFFPYYKGDWLGENIRMEDSTTSIVTCTPVVPLCLL